MVRDIEEPTQRAKDTSATEFCKYREALKVCVEIYDECARFGLWKGIKRVASYGNRRRMWENGNGQERIVYPSTVMARFEDW